jgi:hypothetical protein
LAPDTPATAFDPVFRAPPDGDAGRTAGTAAPNRPPDVIEAKAANPYPSFLHTAGDRQR